MRFCDMCKQVWTWPGQPTCVKCLMDMRVLVMHIEDYLAEMSQSDE